MEKLVKMARMAKLDREESKEKIIQEPIWMYPIIKEV